MFRYTEMHPKSLHLVEYDDELLIDGLHEEIVSKKL